MKRTILAILMVLGFAAGASAQATSTHPCDQPLASPTVAQRGTRVLFCAAKLDEEGVAIDVFNFRIFISGAQVAQIANAVPAMSATSVSGQLYFEYVLPVVTRGTRPVTAQSYTPEGVSAQSNASLWQVGGKPKPPENHGHN